MLIIFLFAALQANCAPLTISVSAESAILMNADTGAVLFEKKPKAKLFPASITKIATAAYALKLKGDDLSEMVKAEQDSIGSVTEEAKQKSNYSLPSHWLVTDSSHMGIKRGEELSLRDLLFGMMIASADDASNVIAYLLGQGSVPKFMEGINAYISEIGCQDTSFSNPHGLHHPKHYTTAYDMALITREALKNPLFCEMVATTRYTRPKTNKQESTILLQTNRLLRAGEFFYPKAIGVKTGWMSKAGNTFVAAARDGDRTLIAVLLNVKDRKDIFRDSIRLFDAAFNQQKTEKVFVKAGSQKHTLEVAGGVKPIKTYVAQDTSISYYPAEEPSLRAYLQWDPLVLPVKKGQRVGELQLRSLEGGVVKTAPLYAQENVGMRLSYKIKKWFVGEGSHPFLYGGAILGFLVLVYFGYRWIRGIP